MGWWVMMGVKKLRGMGGVELAGVGDDGGGAGAGGRQLSPMRRWCGVSFGWVGWVGRGQAGEMVRGWVCLLPAACHNSGSGSSTVCSQSHSLAN